jgi:hypothetical protein
LYAPKNTATIKITNPSTLASGLIVSSLPTSPPGSADYRTKTMAGSWPSHRPERASSRHPANILTGQEAARASIT